MVDVQTVRTGLEKLRMFVGVRREGLLARLVAIRTDVVAAGNVDPFAALRPVGRENDLSVLGMVGVVGRGFLAFIAGGRQYHCRRRDGYK